ncbi:hypothetical protein SEA_SOOS_5 [Gordonia phage Soos]|nr:hypothetical protein SEA_SOOS_5 [Gordonia phage Soos]
MSSMRAVFARIGRNHSAPSMTIDQVKARSNVVDEDGQMTGEIDWNCVAEEIEKYARRWIMSSEVQVLIYEREDGTRHGTLLVGGIRNAGSFEIEEL